MTYSRYLHYLEYVSPRHWRESDRSNIGVNTTPLYTIKADILYCSGCKLELGPYEKKISVGTSGLNSLPFEVPSEFWLCWSYTLYGVVRIGINLGATNRCLEGMVSSSAASAAADKPFRMVFYAVYVPLILLETASHDIVSQGPLFSWWSMHCSTTWAAKTFPGGNAWTYAFYGHVLEDDGGDLWQIQWCVLNVI